MRTPRQLFTLVVAAAVAGALDVGRSVAAEPIPAVRGVPVATGEAAIHEALDRKVSVQFVNQPFEDVLAWLRKEQGLNLAVEGEHADGRADFSELSVTFAAQDQPLKTVLQRLLSDVDLSFAIRDDMLLITSRDQEQAAELRAYDVRDLVSGRGPFDETRDDPRPLIAALSAAVGVGHWSNYLAWRAAVQDGTLLVSQPVEGHQQIQWCLAALRAARDRQATHPGGAPLRVESPEAARFRQSLRRRLEQPATLRFGETPLSDVLAALRDAQQLPIELDAAALHEVSEMPELKISLEVRDLPLRSALKRLLDRLNLTWVIRGPQLLITTSERAAELQRAVVYPVRDLIEDAMTAEGGDEIEAGERLQATILAVVAPQTWEALGGAGALRYVPSAQALVCAQSDQAQAEMARLLDTLRSASRQRAAQDSPAAAAGAAPLRTRLYKLDHAALTEHCVDDLTRLLTSRIEPASWSREGAFVSAVGNRLIVRQTAAVQQRITQLLRVLEVLAAPEAGAPASDADKSATPELAPDAAAPLGGS